MGYDIVDVADLEPIPDRTATGYEISDHYRKDSADPDTTVPPSRGPTEIGLRIYEADPGEALTEGMHYHEEQEETFYVVSGTLVVDTPDQTYTVRGGQAIVIEPESPQLARVPDDATETTHVVAIGAPSYRKLGRNDGVGYP